MSRSAGSDAVDAQISMEMPAAFLHALRVQQCLVTLYVQSAARTLGKGAGPDHQGHELSTQRLHCRPTKSGYETAQIWLLG